MKMIGKNQKLRKVTVAVLLVVMLFSISAMALMPSAEAGDTIPVLEEQGAGVFHLGSVGISDPTKINTGEGYYMQPLSYVYLGEVYNAATRTYDAIICRVLDNDHDNAGNAGAMLLYTESAVEVSRFYRGATQNAEIIGTENIYAASDLAQRQATQYSFRSHYGRHFDNVPEEEDLLVPVTKSDRKADMEGLYLDFLAGIDYSIYAQLAEHYDDYTFSFETDTVKAGSDPLYSAEKSDEVAALQNTTFFPLSADEFHRYMGSLSASKHYASTYALTGEGVSYWLRTGIYEEMERGADASHTSYFDTMENQYFGNLVMGVDASGNLAALPAESEGVYGRFAFNVATDSISYNKLIDGVHKLAFTDPRYAEGESDLFEAEIINTENGIVTLKYTNAIRSRSTVWYGEDEGEYVSVIIKDQEGNIKSYASVAEVPQCYGADEEEKKSSESFTAQFKLPENYDEENDTILVFWERKNADERRASFTSNMVELDCAHTYHREDGTFVKLATCTEQGTCVLCGEDFGEFDPENHANIESGAYEYDDATNTHWQVCPDCGADGAREDCVFPQYCVHPCVCGNLDENSEHHNYNADGFCTRDRSHYEKPQMSVSGYYDITVRITNEGNWLWLAEQIAAGKHQYVIWETYYVYLDTDLDFSGYDFIPLGTAEHPFTGEINSLGRDFTIRDIAYSDPNADGVGIVGVGENVRIVDICVKNVSFEGKSNVGALVGKGTNVDVDGVTVIGDVVLNAASGNVGAFFGSCDSDSSILMSFSHTEREGEISFLPAAGAGTPALDTAYFLSERDGENGCISLETFASGMVAYNFNQRRPGSGWRQTIVGDVRDDYPSRDGGGAYVRITEYCDGTPAIYTNNKKDEMIHDPVELYGFTWDIGYSFCDADVFCARCNQRMVMPAEVQITYDYPKVTYIARIMIDGEYRESEPVVVFGALLEDFIGMSEVTITYSGAYITPDVVMTNHALHESEFIAYFVNSDTGEVYAYTDYNGNIVGFEYLRDVGTYDLVVVGQQGDPWTQVGGNWTEDNTVDRVARNFSGQSVTYERVLTILPAEVTVTPHDVYKYEDGNGTFVPSWSIDNEDFYAGEFEVFFADAPSAAVGDYTLKVTVDAGYHGKNVILKLAKDSVTGSIIEKRNVSIANKNYPTTFTYGETIPTPTASHFTMSANVAFSYEWFADMSGMYAETPVLIPLNGAPKNAGSYVLRAYAGSDGTQGGSYVDVEVQIHKAVLVVGYEFVSGVEAVEERGTVYYNISSFDDVIVKLSGFVNGESADSLGLLVRALANDVIELFPRPSDPARRNSYLDYEIVGDVSNYELEEARESRDYVVSLAGIGLPEIIEEEYSYELNWDNGYYEEDWGFRYEFSWQHPTVDGFILDRERGEHWFYIINVYDISNGIENKVKTGISNVQIGGSDRTYENRYIVRTNKAGHYLITFDIMARDYFRLTMDIPGDDDDVLHMEYYVAIGIEERQDGMVDEIGEIGCYTVTVSAYKDLASYESGSADKVTSHEFFLGKEIQMFFKEIEYNLSDGSFNFELKDIYKHVVMEAGGVFSLGHELADVYISVNESEGYSYVTGFKVVDRYGNDVSYLYKAKSFNRGNVNHTGDGVGTTHIFDSPCDAECNVAGCGYTRAVKHSGDTSGEGNCCKAYVCENCGAAYMPEQPKHLSSKTVIVRCGDDMTVHEVVYVCCGMTQSREGHYSAKAATCRTLAVCDGCGRSYGELDPNNHEETATYESLGEAGHKVSYPCCSAGHTEQHAGGTATCQSVAVCTACKAGYGQPDPNNHVGEIEAKPDPNDPEMHIKAYSCCNVGINEPHAGGTATCLQKAVCTVCGASYGAPDPEHHASDSMSCKVREDNASMHDAYRACCNKYVGKFYHTGGTASCKGGAICEDCGTAYGDADLSRHASDAYKYTPDELDPSKHVKRYACCGEELERGAHRYGEADCVNGATCADCGHADGQTVAHRYANDCATVCEVCGRTGRAEVFHSDENGDEACDVCGTFVENEGLSGGAVSGIVTGSAVAAGAGGFSLFWFVIKKKSLLELLAFFK